MSAVPLSLLTLPTNCLMKLFNRDVSAKFRAIVVKIQKQFIFKCNKLEDQVSEDASLDRKANE